MDILRELKYDEINYILNRLEQKLPHTIKDIYYLQTALKFREASKSHKNLSDKVLPRFYTTRNGIKENCTILGITGDRDHCVWYFSFDESLAEIRECLNSSFIKWGVLDILFVTIHVEQIQPILDYAHGNSLKVKVNEYAAYYTLSREDALSLEIKLPKGTLIRQLEVSDGEFVDSLWAYRDARSKIWVESLIEISGGFALIDEMTREILSYAFLNDHTGIGGLTTVEKAKRKGYGTIVAKYIAKEIALKGLTPIAFIQNENIKSVELFRKLGFEKVGGSNWIIIEAKGSLLDV